MSDSLENPRWMLAAEDLIQLRPNLIEDQEFKIQHRS